MTTRIPNGSLVRLDDGTTATAYLDRDGTYRTAQVNPVTGGTRVDHGWRREQLTVIEELKRISCLGPAREPCRDHIACHMHVAWPKSGLADL